ncbi:YaiI/YqxD family protein [Andreprevotia chitinilytica]|uniref:YaiI/YqxD family protein n=1 Tax=Andreprevotia chitinilytica TaxID=396808 RepID=UPI00054CFD5A|nr:YaiI/YqxD family protein [Andreprevotia chitinilytica]
MNIWVDADACPKVIRDILFRAAERAQINLVLVANQLLSVPASPHIRALQVPRGFDVADNEIAGRAEAGDLVITADIPLASDVIAKGAHVIDFRGETLTVENIRERLTMRDFMDTLRASGVQTGGPAALSAADRQRFARQLDTFIARAKAGR